MGYQMKTFPRFLPSPAPSRVGRLPLCHISGVKKMDYCRRILRRTALVVAAGEGVRIHKCQAIKKVLSLHALPHSLTHTDRQLGGTILSEGVRCFPSFFRRTTFMTIFRLRVVLIGGCVAATRSDRHIFMLTRTIQSVRWCRETHTHTNTRGR